MPPSGQTVQDRTKVSIDGIRVLMQGSHMCKVKVIQGQNKGIIAKIRIFTQFLAHSLRTKSKVHNIFLFRTSTRNSLSNDVST